MFPDARLPEFRSVRYVFTEEFGTEASGATLMLAKLITAAPGAVAKVAPAACAVVREKRNSNQKQKNITPTARNRRFIDPVTVAIAPSF
jgi:hypothetical protein